jgi:hypothetical protein
MTNKSLPLYVCTSKGFKTDANTFTADVRHAKSFSTVEEVESYVADTLPFAFLYPAIQVQAGALFYVATSLGLIKNRWGHVTRDIRISMPFSSFEEAERFGSRWAAQKNAKLQDSGQKPALHWAVLTNV